MIKKVIMYALALVLSVSGTMTFAKQMGFNPDAYPAITQKLDRVANTVSMYTPSEQMMFIDEVEMLIEQHKQRVFITSALNYLLDKVQMKEKANLVEVAVESESFPTLVAALQAAGLVDTLENGGPFTVFAPTEEAFAELLTNLDMTAAELLSDTELLTTVLTYHVVEGTSMAEDVVALPQGTQIPTVQGETLIVDTWNGVEVNNAQVVQTDITASNGVIHVVDSVLLPPSVVESLGGETTRGTQTITSLAVDSGMFPTLVAALQAAGLDDDLADKGPFTVYAPTEEAFANLLTELDMTAEELLSDTDLLMSVLTYHVVPGRYTEQDLMQIEGDVMSPTLNGMSLNLSKENDGFMVNNANIIDTDYFATNGVVHVIDTVLIP